MYLSKIVLCFPPFVGHVNNVRNHDSHRGTTMKMTMKGEDSADFQKNSPKTSHKGFLERRQREKNETRGKFHSNQTQAKLPQRYAHAIPLCIGETDFSPPDQTIKRFVWSRHSYKKVKNKKTINDTNRTSKENIQMPYLYTVDRNKNNQYYEEENVFSQTTTSFQNSGVHSLISDESSSEINENASLHENCGSENSQQTSASSERNKETDCPTDGNEIVKPRNHLTDSGFLSEKDYQTLTPVSINLNKNGEEWLKKMVVSSSCNSYYAGSEPSGESHEYTSTTKGIKTKYLPEEISLRYTSREAHSNNSIIRRNPSKRKACQQILEVFSSFNIYNDVGFYARMAKECRHQLQFQLKKDERTIITKMYLKMLELFFNKCFLNNVGGFERERCRIKVTNAKEDKKLRKRYNNLSRRKKMRSSLHFQSDNRIIDQLDKCKTCSNSQSEKQQQHSKPQHHHQTVKPAKLLQGQKNDTHGKHNLITDHKRGNVNIKSKSDFTFEERLQKRSQGREFSSHSKIHFDKLTLPELTGFMKDSKQTLHSLRQQKMDLERSIKSTTDTAKKAEMKRRYSVTVADLDVTKQQYGESLSFIKEKYGSMTSNSIRRIEQKQTPKNDLDIVEHSQIDGGKEDSDQMNSNIVNNCDINDEKNVKGKSNENTSKQNDKKNKNVINFKSKTLYENNANYEKSNRNPKSVKSSTELPQNKTDEESISTRTREEISQQNGNQISKTSTGNLKDNVTREQEGIKSYIKSPTLSQFNSFSVTTTNSKDKIASRECEGLMKTPVTMMTIYAALKRDLNIASSYPLLFKGKHHRDEKLEEALQSNVLLCRSDSAENNPEGEFSSLDTDKEGDSIKSFERNERIFQQDLRETSLDDFERKSHPIKCGDNKNKKNHDGKNTKSKNDTNFVTSKSCQQGKKPVPKNMNILYTSERFSDILLNPPLIKDHLLKNNAPSKTDSKEGTDGNKENNHRDGQFPEEGLGRNENDSASKIENKPTKTKEKATKTTQCTETTAHQIHSTTESLGSTKPTEIDVSTSKIQPDKTVTGNTNKHTHLTKKTHSHTGETISSRRLSTPEACGASTTLEQESIKTKTFDRQTATTTSLKKFRKQRNIDKEHHQPNERHRNKNLTPEETFEIVQPESLEEISPSKTTHAVLRRQDITASVLLSNSTATVDLKEIILPDDAELTKTTEGETTPQSTDVLMARSKSENPAHTAVSQVEKINIMFYPKNSQEFERKNTIQKNNSYLKNSEHIEDNEESVESEKTNGRTRNLTINGQEFIDDPLENSFTCTNETNERILEQMENSWKNSQIKGNERITWERSSIKKLDENCLEVITISNIDVDGTTDSNDTIIQTLDYVECEEKEDNLAFTSSFNKEKKYEELINIQKQFVESGLRLDENTNTDNGIIQEENVSKEDCMLLPTKRQSISDSRMIKPFSLPLNSQTFDEKKDHNNPFSTSTQKDSKHTLIKSKTIDLGFVESLESKNPFVQNLSNDNNNELSNEIKLESVNQHKKSFLGNVNTSDDYFRPYSENPFCTDKKEASKDCENKSRENVKEILRSKEDKKSERKEKKMNRSKSFVEILDPRKNVFLEEYDDVCQTALCTKQHLDGAESFKAVLARLTSKGTEKISSITYFDGMYKTKNDIVIGEIEECKEACQIVNPIELLVDSISSKDIPITVTAKDSEEIPILIGVKPHYRHEENSGNMWTNSKRTVILNEMIDGNEGNHDNSKLDRRHKSNEERHQNEKEYQHQLQDDTLQGGIKQPKNIIEEIYEMSRELSFSESDLSEEGEDSFDCMDTFEESSIEEKDGKIRNQEEEPEVKIKRGFDSKILEKTNLKKPIFLQGKQMLAEEKRQASDEGEVKKYYTKGEGFIDQLRNALSRNLKDHDHTRDVQGNIIELEIEGLNKHLSDQDKKILNTFILLNVYGENEPFKIISLLSGNMRYFIRLIKDNSGTDISNEGNEEIKGLSNEERNDKGEISTANKEKYTEELSMAENRNEYKLNHVHIKSEINNINTDSGYPATSLQHSNETEVHQGLAEISFYNKVPTDAKLLDAEVANKIQRKDECQRPCLVKENSFSYNNEESQYNPFEGAHEKDSIVDRAQLITELKKTSSLDKYEKPQVKSWSIDDDDEDEDITRNLEVNEEEPQQKSKNQVAGNLGGTLKGVFTDNRKHEKPQASTKRTNEKFNDTSVFPFEISYDQNRHLFVKGRYVRNGENVYDPVDDKFTDCVGSKTNLSDLNSFCDSCGLQVNKIDKNVLSNIPLENMIKRSGTETEERVCHCNKYDTGKIQKDYAVDKRKTWNTNNDLKWITLHIYRDNDNKNLILPQTLKKNGEKTLYPPIMTYKTNEGPPEESVFLLYHKQNTTEEDLDNTATREVKLQRYSDNATHDNIQHNNNTPDNKNIEKNTSPNNNQNYNNPNNKNTIIKLERFPYNDGKGESSQSNCLQICPKINDECFFSKNTINGLVTRGTRENDLVQDYPLNNEMHAVNENLCDLQKTTVNNIHMQEIENDKNLLSDEISVGDNFHVKENLDEIKILYSFDDREKRNGNTSSSLNCTNERVTRKNSSVGNIKCNSLPLNEFCNITTSMRCDKKDLNSFSDIHSLPLSTNRAVSTSNCLLVDLGSGIVKAGLSTQDNPLHIPSIAGTPNYNRVFQHGAQSPPDIPLMVGKDAMSFRGILKLYHPIDHGNVNDWNALEKMLDHIFYSVLCVDPSEHALLISENAFTTRKTREHLMEIMFESHDVPAYYTVLQGVLNLYSSGATTGVVVDVGDSTSQVTPVYDGYSIQHAIQKVKLGGRDIDEHLQKFVMLQEGVGLLKKSNEMEIIRDMKEKLCFVSPNGLCDQSVASYKLPDGHLIYLKEERYKAPELLFDPLPLGKEHLGIHHILHDSVQACDIDLRSELFSNIILSGGSTLFTGFEQRFTRELESLVTRKKIRTRRNKEQVDGVWTGARILSSLATFSSLCINREEYEEYGTCVVHKKCF